MALNKLPAEFLDLNEMGSQTRGVSILYGRRADGSLVAINVADDGTIASGATFSAGSIAIKDATSSAAANVQVTGGLPNALVVAAQGSKNSYFADQTILALTGAFQAISFGFTSFNISVFNDDSTQILEYSFNGTLIHGRLKVGEAVSMDYRAQSGIYLRNPGGSGGLYRIAIY